MPALLVVVSGLPGVGKSAVARLVAERAGAVHLSVDPVEEALLGAGLEPTWSTGVAAYEAVRAVAESNLTLGRTVVVDAVNDSEPARETWQRAATQTDAGLRWIVLTCSDPTEHARRLEQRRRGFSYVAEPTWAAVLERATAYAPWSVPVLEIDTTARSIEDVADRVVACLR